MKFHNEQLQILKGMIIDYQSSPKDEIFLQILKRVDKMLTETIVNFSKIYYFGEPIQDLYQSGVVGLKNAIDAFNPNTKETAIPMCIFYWVRKELFETYGIKRFDVSKYLYEHPNCTKKADIDRNLIQEDIQKILKDTIDSGKLTEEEICLAVLVHIEDMPINEIPKIFGDRWGTDNAINRRVNRITRILKREFEKKGFGYD